MQIKTNREEKKNIIFLMTDQHRADYVGFSSNSKVETPNIDRIAEGISFSNCTSVNPLCQPARTALLTGKYSHQIGMVSMSGDLSLQHPTYLRALQKAGYHTSGIGKFHWLQGWKWGTSRGKGHNLEDMKEEFEKFGLDFIWEASGKQLTVKNYCDYCKHLDDKGLLEAYRDHIQASGPNTMFAEQQQFNGDPFPFPEEDYVDIVTGDKIIECIANRKRDQPFFIYGSFCGPHPPYDAPQKYIDMIPYEEYDDFVTVDSTELSEGTKKNIYKLRRVYKAMIKVIDEQVGRIFKKLEEENLLDDTVIVFTADHGEMMGDRGRAQKALPYWQSVNVPTAVRHPAYLCQRKNDSLVEITDLTATILEIAGINWTEALSLEWPDFNNIVPARSLMPVIRGEKNEIREYSFSECWNSWQMVQSKGWKYIKYLDTKSPEELHEEFYNLDLDPDELINLAGNNEYDDMINRHRRYLIFLMDHTPPAQLRWAPLIE